GVSSVERPLPAIQQAETIAVVVDADIRLVRYEDDSRPGRNVAVVGEIVVFAVRALDPRIENGHEGIERHRAAFSGEKFHVDSLQIHRYALLASEAAGAGTTVAPAASLL